jgi:hypothetical protein
MSLTGQATPATSNVQFIINTLADYAKEIETFKNPFATRLKP